MHIGCISPWCWHFIPWPQEGVLLIQTVVVKYENLREQNKQKFTTLFIFKWEVVLLYAYAGLLQLAQQLQEDQVKTSCFLSHECQ